MVPRTRLALLLALGGLSASSCGGGVKHLGEITPAVSQRLSGTWHLDEAESDDAEAVLARGGAGAARPEGRGGSGVRPQDGGRNGGGMTGRGRMPPGGGMTGRGGAGARPDGRVAEGGRMDPGAMSVLRRMAIVPASTLEISLADSAAVVSLPREEPWLLPFGEGVKRGVDEDFEVEARADWESGRLVLTRSVKGGGSVTEIYMPSVDGTRLTVAVSFSPRGRGGVEFQRVYQRQ